MDFEQMPGNFSELNTEFMKNWQPILAFILFGYFYTVSGQILAQAPPQNFATTILDHLTREEGAKMTLETDLTTILEQKKSNEYFPGTLTTSEGEVYQLEVRRRGKFRRMKAELPPLKLKFKKKALVTAGFDTLNEMKLVLPFRTDDVGDEWLVREYLAYRMFEHLTPVSIRARLIRLTLRDSHVEKYKKTVYAMLIEDDEFTAARLGANIIEEYGIHPDSFLMNQAALVSMFNYMIGNTDWDVSMSRNVRLVKSPESGKILTLPYDFDFSGFVHTNYASPSLESGLKNNRQRFLMANGIRPESLKTAVKILRAAKKDLYSICKSKHVSRDAIDDMQTYLDSFFDAVKESDEVPSVMVD